MREFAPAPDEFDSAMADEIQSLRKIYASELPEKTEKLKTLVAAVRKSKADVIAVNEIFRAAHSMKGAAAMYGFPALADLGDAGECALTPVCAGKKPATDELCAMCDEWILALTDVVKAAANGVERSAAEYPVFHKLKKWGETP